MKLITKKCWPEYYIPVAEGKKNFDIRLDDKSTDFKVGDFLLLQEWDNAQKKYTGRAILKQISYVVKTDDLPFWKRKTRSGAGCGFIVLGLADPKVAK